VHYARRLLYLFISAFLIYMYSCSKIVMGLKIHPLVPKLSGFIFDQRDKLITVTCPFDFVCKIEFLKFTAILKEFEFRKAYATFFLPE